MSAKKTALADYIDGGDARAWIRKESNLIVSSLDPQAVLKRISAGFVSAQTTDWLHRFYAYLSERESYRRVVSDRPIFLDEGHNAVPAFDSNGQLVLFLPDDDIEGYTTVSKELLSNDRTREFVSTFGITNSRGHLAGPGRLPGALFETRHSECTPILPGPASARRETGSYSPHKRFLGPFRIEAREEPVPSSSNCLH